MMVKRFAGIFGAAIVLAAGSVTAQNADSTTSEPLAVLKALEKRYAQVTTIQGNFKQERVDETFGETISTSGNFWLAKPDRLRVEYQAPNEATDMLVEGVAYQYVPKLRQVTMVRYKNKNTPMDLNFLLLGFGAKVENVQKVYNVMPLGKTAPKGKVGLRLVPKDAKQANFKNFELMLDQKSLVPTDFSFKGMDGTLTKAVLDDKKLKIDQTIDASRFKPNWPEKTRVVEVE